MGKVWLEAVTLAYGCDERTVLLVQPHSHLETRPGAVIFKVATRRLTADVDHVQTTVYSEHILR